MLFGVRSPLPSLPQICAGRAGSVVNRIFRLAGPFGGTFMDAAALSAGRTYNTVANIRARDSFKWRMILPVPLAIAAAIAAIWILLPRLIARDATQEAELAGKQVAEQFKTIRGYYTDEVVAKVLKKGGLKASFAHKGVDNAIPLPATMIEDLSELFAKRDLAIKDRKSV